MKTSIKLLAGIAALIISFYVQAYPGEGIVLDPATGNYTITYRGNPNSTELSQTIFVPATKIAPTIHSSFRLGKNGVIVYRYSVSNGLAAKQTILGFRLDQIVNPVVGELPFPADPVTQAADAAYDAAIKVAVATPDGWYGNIIRYRVDTHGENLDRIAWRPKPPIKTSGIRAGLTLTGFGFSSLDLPGVGPSNMDGLGEVFGFPDEGPVEDSAVLDELNRLRDNDFITLPAAVPMVVVPSPFDAATLLERIQTQMHTWIGKQLLDATFSSQLDRYFQSAISAYRLNQPKVGKKEIQTMRELLKKEHADADRDEGGDDRGEKGDHDDKNKQVLIDKLAARILDFDLKYVTKRMGGDRDD
jgi:hypothetical protein